MLFSNPQLFIIISVYLIPGLLLGLVLHEYAHARVAVARGDQTPRIDGRLSLDPGRHLDPLGTVAVFLIHFGWAQPVRINPARMHHRLDPALVALAGPVTNLLIAVALSIPLRLLLAAGVSPAVGTFLDSPAAILTEFILMGFYLNVVLALFNILPVPPLDGYNLVATLFRRRFPRFFFQIDANRQVITLVLILVVFFLPQILGSLFLSAYAPVSNWLLGGIEYPF